MRGSLLPNCKTVESSEIERQTVVHSEERMFKVLIKTFVKEGASQLQNFLVNFHKFHAISSIILLQLG
jgi:hypothetical protein